MEQRRLRLGDILDDYCPRERRVTNHAVVAMIEEDVKQTRCTTCDAEHAYKGGREPRRRKKDTTAGLYREVLAGMGDAEGPAQDVSAIVPPVVDTPAEEPVPLSADAPVEVEPDAPAPSEHDAEPEREDRENGDSDGPIHRRLIRATLPRPEGQKEARPLPEFTAHRAVNRHQGFRDRSRGQGNGNGNGNGMRAGGRRFGGGNQPGTGGARGRGGRPGFGGGGGQQRPTGRKRSR